MYDPRLYKMAVNKGWHLPATNNPLGSKPWNNYWSAMEEYEKNTDKGRPVVPHRSA
jgi:hypothetical protein